MADSVKGYWRLIEPVWDEIDIYEGETAFLETYGRVDRNAGLLFAAHFAQSEICNGGFNQFFSNSTGILAPEAIEGMRLIGMNQIASNIERAMTLFGGSYPRERSQRQAILKGIGREALSYLDKEFFRLIRTEANGFKHAADIFVEGLLRN